MTALSGSLMFEAILVLKFFKLFDFAPECYELNSSMYNKDFANIEGASKVSALSIASYKIRWLEALRARGKSGLSSLILTI